MSATEQACKDCVACRLARGESVDDRFDMKDCDKPPAPVVTVDPGSAAGSKYTLSASGQVTISESDTAQEALVKLTTAAGKREEVCRFSIIDAHNCASLLIPGFKGLSYERTSPNPYKDDADAEVIDIHKGSGDDENEYWYDGKKLVQVGPTNRGGTSTPRKLGPILGPSLLRDVAVNLITTQVPDFRDLKTRLHPLEDSRNAGPGKIYFFRWDKFDEPAKESELPPFVQIGLYADGTLASYTNILP